MCMCSKHARPMADVPAVHNLSNHHKEVGAHIFFKNSKLMVTFIGYYFLFGFSLRKE